MSDLEFVDRFERCQLESFRHRDHVRVAWVYVSRFEWTAALERMRRGIQRFAAHAGAPTKYHETLTVAWLAAVAELVHEAGPTPDFDGFIQRHPQLLDAGLLRAHYSDDVLSGPRARAEWVAPDLRPFTAAPVV